GVAVNYGPAHPRALALGYLSRAALDLIKADIAPEVVENVLATEKRLPGKVPPVSYRTRCEELKRSRQLAEKIKGVTMLQKRCKMVNKQARAHALHNDPG
ncbi:unnamed protein product, partial [Amoebophrya sp. A25]